LFFLESPGTPWSANPQLLTAFAAEYATERCLDLTAPPHDARAAAWTHPTDYAPCHAIADEAREQGCGAIRSASARDPAGAMNVSLLTCAAFAAPEPTARMRWRLKLGAAGVIALAEDGQ